LQNAQCSLARVTIRVRVTIRARVRYRSEICKLCMHDFEVAQHILQIVQFYKLCATNVSLF